MASSENTAAPVENVENNEVYRHFVGGDYVLWGFFLRNNGVPQVFVNKETLDSDGLRHSVKVAGSVSSPETPPSLFDFYFLRYQGQDVKANLACSLKIAFSGTDAALVGCGESNLANVKWAMRLKQQDVAGKLVKDYVTGDSGTPLSIEWVNPAATFPAGSLAYTASYEAVSDMVVMPESPLRFFEDPVGSGWCRRVPGQSYSLGARLNADKTISMFEVAGSACDFAGLTAIGVGSWEVTQSPLGNAYKIAYPDAVVNDQKWQLLFAGARTPMGRMGTRILPCNQWWCVAQEVKKGERFDTAQPHFNEAAVPGLKAVHGLQ